MLQTVWFLYLRLWSKLAEQPEICIFFVGIVNSKASIFKEYDHCCLLLDRRVSIASDWKCVIIANSILDL